KDPQGNSTQRTFVIQVTDLGAPTVAAVSAQSVMRTQAFSLTLATPVDPDGQTLTYTVLSKPDWLSFNPATLVLTGTPPAGTALGPQFVNIEVRDPQFGSVLVSFPITVNNVPPTWVATQPDVRTTGGGMNYTPPVLATDVEGPVH